MLRGIQLLNDLIFSVSCHPSPTPMLRLAVAHRQDEGPVPKLPSCILKQYNIGEFWRRSLHLEIPHAHLLVPSRETTMYPLPHVMERGCMSSSSPRMRRRRVPGRITLLSGLGMSRVRQPRVESNRASFPVFPRRNPNIQVAAAVRINSSLRWIPCRQTLDMEWGWRVAPALAFGLECSLGEYGSIRQWAASPGHFATARRAAVFLTLGLHGSWRSPLNQLHYSLRRSSQSMADVIL